MRRIVRPSALVEAYFDTLAPPQALGIRALRDVVLAAVPELEPTVLWGDLAFMVQGRNLLSIGAHKTYASLQISNGALLEAAFPELEGHAKGMRLVKLRFGEPVDLDRLQALVRASFALARGASR
jgi:hypothetical protein